MTRNWAREGENETREAPTWIFSIGEKMVGSGLIKTKANERAVSFGWVVIRDFGRSTEQRLAFRWQGMATDFGCDLVK
jgi:hypothetical protein